MKYLTVIIFTCTQVFVAVSNAKPDRHPQNNLCSFSGVTWFTVSKVTLPWNVSMISMKCS